MKKNKMKTGSTSTIQKTIVIIGFTSAKLFTCITGNVVLIYTGADFTMQSHLIRVSIEFIDNYFYA